MMDLPPVVHRDRHLLVVSKPPGLATTAPDGGDCLAARVRLLDPDAPRLHPTSRLDRDVTGLVTFARTKRGTEALSKARAEGRYDRLYVGIAIGALEASEGAWDAPISIEPRDRRLRRLGAGEREQAAFTQWQVVDAAAGALLLHLRPRTGRTHQLRVHAAGTGVPLFGDVAYGGPRRHVLTDGRVITARRPMLHCHRLRLPRVVGEGELELVDPLPQDFERAWARLWGEG